MAKRKPKLIVALDVDKFETALGLLDQLKGTVDIFKVGSQLFTACGPVIVRHILSRGCQVFVDLKFHDIPNTVASAVSSLVQIGAPVAKLLDNKGKAIPAPGAQGIFMCTLHTLGGEEMLKYAVASALKTSATLKVPKPLLVGITVLTSDQKKDSLPDLVLERARLAKRCGLDGVVASPQEAAMIRKEMGDDFVIVTPGIRPAGDEANDQKRVATPIDAVKSGSDFLVVGRPIIGAADPLAAAKKILNEIKS